MVWNTSKFGCLEMENKLSKSEIYPEDGRLLLAAAVIYMGSASGDISREQWGQLHSVVGENEPLLDKALEKVRNTPIEEFLVELLEKLQTEEQKLCVLLNAYDCMLADERSTSEELLVFEKFKNSFALEIKDLDVYLSGILIKNNIRLLGSR